VYEAKAGGIWLLRPWLLCCLHWKQGCLYTGCCYCLAEQVEQVISHMPGIDDEQPTVTARCNFAALLVASWPTPLLQMQDGRRGWVKEQYV